MTAGVWNLKAASIGLSALRKELKTCSDPKRRAVIERQLPQYIDVVERFKAAAKKEKAA